MLFNQSAEYAIRASIAIANKPREQYALVKDLSDELGIPTHYLAKILQQLARVRLLESARGRSGGFRLARDAESIRLIELVTPFEDVQKAQHCVLGLKLCLDDNPCPMHEFWKSVRTRYFKEIETKTLGDLARFEKRRLAGKAPAAR
ncbi:MAG: Rrf2 family transcriptional regulator [Planctomycetes bacterium]|nr:Rrf2 family transcriptional regulator [Planctomycetota bacterium]